MLMFSQKKKRILSWKNWSLLQEGLENLELKGGEIEMVSEKKE